MKKALAALALAAALAGCTVHRTTMECDSPNGNHFKCTFEERG